jgi:hypothetical protein
MPSPLQPIRRPAWQKWLVQLLLPLAAGAGLLAGLILLGDWARDRLHQDGRRTIAFTDVECEGPPGLSREQFLEETQYLADLPDRLNLLDADANARIASALAAHPWVEEVTLVEQVSPGRVRAKVVYRVGVLCVAGPGRIVDRHGVLLPASAENKGLPVLRGRVRPPTDGPGKRWPDETVLAAAAVAGFLRPHLAAPGLAGCTIDVESGDVVLRTAQTRIIWGRPPGREEAEECPAEEKLQRLLEARDLTGMAVDLRPKAEVKRSRKP